MRWYVEHYAGLVAPALLTLYLSVLIESVPFLIIGTLVATMVKRFSLLEKALPYLPRHPLARRLCMPFIGVLLPVCECGNVPLTRTLMQRGLNVGDATTFLLAAPILNPITFWTTREAFRQVPWMTPARMLIGFVVALVVGQVVHVTPQPLQDAFITTCTHHRPESFLSSFSNEFWPLLRLLAFGGLLAALMQNFGDRIITGGVYQNALLVVVMMLVVSFVISICSNVDAFFALGFIGLVPPGALLTFLVAGAMVDIKSIAMLSRTYTLRALTVMVGCIAVMTVLIGWWAVRAA